MENFYMIVSGEVDILASDGQSHELRLACLGPGQFFGEVELTQGGQSIASVRAARRGAEVALLPKDVFFTLVEGSTSTKNVIHEVAQSRLAENIGTREKNQ